MGQRIIDLSLPIISGQDWTKYPAGVVYGHEEPPTTIEQFSTIEQTTVCMYKYASTTQSYTHLDVPRHVYEEGATLEQVSLDLMVGEAAVIDMMHKQARDVITGADLEDAGGHVKAGDIALIRTGWTERGPWGTERFWRDMIYMDEDAGEWLDQKDVKAIAVDFSPDLPQFYIDDEDKLQPTENGHPTHMRLLKKDFVIIEWLTNVMEIKQQRVDFFALPLPLVGTDGAQARVIAVEKD